MCLYVFVRHLRLCVAHVELYARNTECAKTETAPPTCMSAEQSSKITTANGLTSLQIAVKLFQQVGSLECSTPSSEEEWQADLQMFENSKWRVQAGAIAQVEYRKDKTEVLASQTARQSTRRNVAKLFTLLVIEPPSLNSC